MADKDDERLQELEDEIHNVKDRVKETAGDPGERREYVESGSPRSEALDDQSITPPG